MKHFTLIRICLFFSIVALCFLPFNHLVAQPYETWIEFSNAAGCDTTSTTTCSVPFNQADFWVKPQDPEPPKNGSRAVPRFKAFWITGDGNYLWFNNTSDDSESRNPPPYNYSSQGNYNVSVYLTGKYTDKNPPPGALRQINVGPLGASATIPSPYAPTAFNRFDSLPLFNLFAIHELRRNYLTPIVLSYPASVDSSWVYLFYNGKGNRAGAWPQRPLVFRKNEGIHAAYFTGDFSKISSNPSGVLSSTFDDTRYVPEFISLGRFYNDFVYFPLDTALASNMPQGFIQKRYFPVFWADSLSRIVIGERDSLMSFCMVVTGTRPLPLDSRSQWNEYLNKFFDIKFDIGSPINFLDGEMISSMVKGRQSPPKYQYIQGVYTTDVRYVSAHDPNQLTVQKIEDLGNGKYKVTFHLEMCNKGADNSNRQQVVLHDRFGNFTDFQHSISRFTSLGSNKYIDTFQLSIPGIPRDEYEMMCDGFDFTAITNCDGIKSLWNGNREEALQVCVRFLESNFTECSDNFPIDRCQYKIDGQCPCVAPIPNGDCCMLLCFLIAIIALIALFWLTRIRS